MRTNLLAGTAVFALWAWLGWNVVVGPGTGTKVQPEASLALSDVAGTDCGECLAHPDICDSLRAEQ
jgi:hypothetical protein